MPKQTTDKKRNLWLARCREEFCNKEKIRCPVCRHPGHVVTHKVSDDEDAGTPRYDYKYPVRIAIQHSHFVENQDAGRNMYCETDEYYYASDKEIVTAWKIPLEVKNKIIARFEEEFRQ